MTSEGWLHYRSARLPLPIRQRKPTVKSAFIKRLLAKKPVGYWRPFNGVARWYKANDPANGQSNKRFWGGPKDLHFGSA